MTVMPAEVFWVTVAPLRDTYCCFPYSEVRGWIRSVVPEKMVKQSLSSAFEKHLVLGMVSILDNRRLHEFLICFTCQNNVLIAQLVQEICLIIVSWNFYTTASCLVL